MLRFSRNLNALNGILFAILTLACIIAAIIRDWYWLIPAAMTGLISTISIVDAINEEHN